MDWEMEKLVEGRLDWEGRAAGTAVEEWAAWRAGEATDLAVEVEVTRGVAMARGIVVVARVGEAALADHLETAPAVATAAEGMEPSGPD